MLLDVAYNEEKSLMLFFYVKFSCNKMN